MKSDKIPYIFYANIQSLLKKVDVCANNSENSATTKIGEHIPSRYSISTIWGFDLIEDKHISDHEKDCMKKFCTSLRQHSKSRAGFEKKNLLPLTIEELKSHQDAKVCCICGKRILKKLSKA